MASGGPTGGQTFEKFDKQVLSGLYHHAGDCFLTHPNPFVQIFKIWPPGRAAGGIKQT
jgi:hypothetical protein